MASVASAEQIRVAVASNFTLAARALAADFERQSDHTLKLAFGSTGKHYAQIVNGAPFDVFLAADQQRPQRLEELGIAVDGSRFSYAIGRLALWSNKSNLVDRQGQILADGNFKRLAIANPKLAPYGRAARQFLQQRGLWETLRPKMVYGENIGQTLQFTRSGNAELGLVAWSQVKYPQQTISGSYWLVPESSHQPIIQQGVLLTGNESAKAFWRYLQTPQAQALIASFGYDVDTDDSH